MADNLQRVRFGDYEADLRTGTLRNSGIPIRLQQQPFRILELLVRNAGELVTREQIRQALWPSDTHVGFDIGLNRAVNRLRNALNDTADAPRFIETIAGRGYRFIAPVAAMDTAARKSEPITIGVVPFHNRTGERELDYLCDGITEDVNFELARASRLRVTAPSTMIRYREAEAEKIASALNLDFVLQGEIARRADKITLRLELLERGSAAMLWGTRYETSLDEVQPLKSEIAAQVWRALGVDPPRKTNSVSASPLAYRLYLQGRFYWNRRTAEGMRQAISSFQKAIEADLEYAPAYSGLADAYSLLAVSPYCAAPPKTMMPKARAAAERAIAFDPNLAEAHASAAMVEFNYDWDFPKAEKSFLRAIELNGSYAPAHQWYSLLLIAQGRYEEARKQAALARDLDPLSATANALVGVSLYFGREPLNAQEELQSLVQAEATSSLAWSFLGMCCIALKQLDRAELAFQKALEISPENVTAWAGLGNVWARKGEQERVNAIFTRLEQLQKERYIPPQVRVFLHIGTGDLEQAMDWLERSYEERCDFLAYINVDPALDPLRGMKRFEELRGRIGIRRSEASF